MYKTAFATLFLLSFSLMAQDAPRFEVDPTWPKGLPVKWINGQLGGVCVDAHDHIVVVDRRNITEEEHETSEQAPPIIMFDMSGEVVASWGDMDRVPDSLHGCSFDTDNNVWVAGNNDGIIQKYSHEGELLVQIGTRGRFDTSDGTMEGERRNSSHEQFFLPSAVVVDPDNGDIYVADGYGNRRVAVFDETGKGIAFKSSTRWELSCATSGSGQEPTRCPIRAAPRGGWPSQEIRSKDTCT